MTAVVEATGIGKRYGSLVAVEDLTFAAEAGEILGVLGPNGAGKTTAIRVLLALFVPTQFPSSAQQGWAGELLQRLNPLTAGEHYVGRILVSGHAWSDDVSWLASTLVAAMAFPVAALLLGSRFVKLRGGVSG